MASEDNSPVVDWVERYETITKMLDDVLRLLESRALESEINIQHTSSMKRYYIRHTLSMNSRRELAKLAEVPSGR